MHYAFGFDAVFVLAHCYRHTIRRPETRQPGHVETYSTMCNGLSCVLRDRLRLEQLSHSTTANDRSSLMMASRPTSDKTNPRKT